MNRFELLAIEDDGTPVKQQVVTPKKAASATQSSPKKTSDKPASASKGKMEGDSRGKSAKPEATGVQGEEPALPDRPDRGAALRGGRRPAPPTNRNFDRHSRSGRKQEGEKRQYSGKGNWGNPTDAAAEAVATEETTTAAVENGAEEFVVVEETATTPFITLDQYLAEKKKPVVAVPSARAANDGAKIDGEVVKKTEDLYFQSSKPTATTAATAAGKKKQEKPAATKLTLQQLNAVIPGGINRPPRPAREENPTPRKDTRGSRNNGPRRGGNRDFRSAAPSRQVSNVNIKDAASFPAL